MAAGSDASERYADFHRPAFRDFRWLETNYYGFYVPEAGIRGHMRAAFRVNQGVVFTLVAIYSRSGGVLDMDLWDSQMHVPMGTCRYSDFRLDSGLAFRASAPSKLCSVRFKSRCGRVAVETEHEAMMPPAGLDFSALASDANGFASFLRPTPADAPIGHVDQTHRVRGKLRIDADVYDIDCVANHDHSWSPRAEFKSSCGIFDNLHFGEDLTIFTMGSEPRLGQPQVTHGYVLRGHELRKIGRVAVEYKRRGFITEALRYSVTDSAGDQYEIEAPVSHAIEQDQGSNGYTVMNYCKPRWKGREGYGESMWHWDIPKMQGIVRRARKEQGDVSIAAAFDALARSSS
jgi:hypothetical protein